MSHIRKVVFPMIYSESTFLHILPDFFIFLRISTARISHYKMEADIC